MQATKKAMHTHHDQLFHNHFFSNPLNQLYVSMAIRSFGISLVGLFIPVYLHVQLGYTLQQTLVYFISAGVFFALVTPLVAMMTHKIGIKHVIALSVPFYIATLFLLYFLQYAKVPLWIIGLLG
jgi:hypothetical protein